MNLAVPYSWLKEYVTLGTSAKEVASRMSLTGCSIDRIRTLEGETVFDVEITTNRPDAHSLMGFAREVATVFKNGPSTQAIRIPREYRLATKEVWV